MLKQNKGITLIALVITIIVLLILAGVSISAVMGENGIGAKAKEAKEETRAGEVQEVIDLWKTEVSAKELDEDWGDIKGEDDVLQELLDSGKIKESEINRTNKTITIGNKVINYSLEVHNPYEAQLGSYDLLYLYNKDTGEYEYFGERVVIEQNGIVCLDEDVSAYVNTNTSTGGFPSDAPNLALHNIPCPDGNIKVTIYKNGHAATVEGSVYLGPL